MRIKRTVNALKKRRKIFRLAKGYFGNKSKSYRIAREAVMKSLNYAYIGRRLRKRDMRSLWIARINAAARTTKLKPKTEREREICVRIRLFRLRRNPT